MKLRYLLIFLIISLQAERAWICVPVADLIGQRMSSITPEQPILHGYSSMPHYGKGGWACPRIGQALFGQEVELNKIDGNEALIGIKNLFYESQEKKQNQYWTLKESIVTQNQLRKANIDLSKLPLPIDFNSPSKILHHSVTLNEPWKGYSVGTRFVRIPTQDTKNFYCVYKLNPKLMKMKKEVIPKKLCIIHTHQKSILEKRQCFVNLLKRWAHRDAGFIPYVWGGFSIRSTCKQDSFILDKRDNGNKEEIRTTRPEKDHEHPKSGLDCSGLIALAAQCCGMPYYYKNTTTIGKHLKELQPTDTIQAGDLIWFRGHVLAISSLAPARVIESRGYTLKRYAPGCGKVHEIALEKVFKDMKTIEQLRADFFEGKPLQRIDGYGNIGQVFGWKILKLM